MYFCWSPFITLHSLMMLMMMIIIIMFDKGGIKNGDSLTILSFKYVMKNF